MLDEEEKTYKETAFKRINDDYNGKEPEVHKDANHYLICQQNKDEETCCSQDTFKSLRRLSFLFFKRASKKKHPIVHMIDNIVTVAKHCAKDGICKGIRKKNLE